MTPKKRVIKNFRYGKIAGWLRRNSSKRRVKIKEIRDLYNRLGLIDSPCPICKSTDFQLLSEADRYGFDIKKQICLSCNLVQSNPRPSKEFHNIFYSKHYRKLYTGRDLQVDYESMTPDFNAKGKVILDIFQKVELSNLKDYNVIEIGCSSGGILKYLEPFVKDVYGCDLDEEAVEYANNLLNLKVNLGGKPKVIPKTKNIFILSHVLEHVFDPLQFIVEIRSNLKSSDLLYIAVPGLNMVKHGTYKYDLRRYFHLAHVTDFTKNTLENLLITAGFKTLYIDEKIESVFKIDQNQKKIILKKNKNAINDILDIVKRRNIFNSLFN